MPLSYRLRFVILVVLLALASSAAQDPPAGNKQNKLVILPLAVWDEHGNYVKDLKPENLELRDGKDVRSIEVLENQDAPISVGILIDTSGSMALPELKEIMEPRPVIDEMVHFVELGNPGNEYFLLAFDKSPRVLTEWTDGKGLSLHSTPLPDKKNMTALFDACLLAIDKLRSAHNSRRVLIIISDGQDNSSRQKFKNLRESARRSDALIYGILVRTFPDYSSLGLEGKENLMELAAATGGEVFIPADKKQMHIIVESLAADLHYQYRIGFRAPAATSGDQWHKLKVKVRQPLNPIASYGTVSVRTRDGYYP